MTSSSLSAQAPTIVVLTQCDRKAEFLLFGETDDLSTENISRLMPRLKQEALDFCFVVKGEVLGPDKNTQRSLRFAVLGGLASQNLLLLCFGRN